MAMQNIETLLIESLVDSRSDRVWRVEDVNTLIEQQTPPINKRTLERRIASIHWLRATEKNSVAVDELNRPAVRAVLDALVSNTRKKRKAALFVQQHPLPSQGSSGDAIHVLVAEDGKASKRWCVLPDTRTQTIRNGLEVLSEGKPHLFFPSGSLVAVSREIQKEQLKKTAVKKVEIITAQFPDLPGRNSKLTPETKKVATSNPKKLSHLDRLEAESLHIIREVMANSENPVMLYSVGKDSSVMLHLARKAFYPSPPPFPLMHVDTRWKFRAMYDFRDKMATESNMELIVHINPEGIEKNINPFDHGSALHTDIMKTQGLKQALDLHQFDVAFGGARRDEEKSRAKERIFSFRSSSHRWDPKNQRPELWNLYNCRKAPGESVRVFPLSNWTELDIWQYIYRESIPIVPLYFAAERPVVRRNGMLIMIDDDRIQLLPSEKIEIKRVRFRTLGCYPLTGAVESSATDLSQIVLELLQSRTSERQGRAIDSDSSASMEKKKQEGYF